MGGPFKIVLASVERRVGPEVLGNPTVERVVRELARLFALDPDTSRSIATATPIVLVDGLDGHSAQVLRDRLRVLVDMGCKVVVTDELSDTMPRIDWPELPPIARVDPPSHSHGPRNGSAPPSGLECPGCGLLLQLVRSEGVGPPARDAAGIRGATDVRGATGGGAVERDAPPLAPPTREPARAIEPPPPAGMEEDDDADWLAPPPPTRATNPGRTPAPQPRGEGTRGTGRSTGRFDDPALLPRSSAPPVAQEAPAPAPIPAPAPAPLPAPTPTAPTPTNGSVNGHKDSGTLRVAFAPPSDESSISGLGALDDELDEIEARSSAGPVPKAKDPLALLDDSQAEVNLEERRSQRRRADSRSELDVFESGSARVPAAAPEDDAFAAAASDLDDLEVDPAPAPVGKKTAKKGGDPFGDPFGDEDEDPFSDAADPFSDAADPFADLKSEPKATGTRAPEPKAKELKAQRGAARGESADPFASKSGSSSRSGFPGDQPFPAASPFEDSGNMASLSDSASDLLGPAPPLKGSPKRAEPAEPPARRAEAASRRPVPDDLDSDLDLFDDDEIDPLAESVPGRPPAELGSSDSLDDLLVDDESAPAAPRKKEKSRARASHPELPDIQGSQDPELDQVLRMFGPEDEQPLDDLGLDPTPPELVPSRGGGGRGKAPVAKRRGMEFGGDMSDILEPLDPDEALKIMKGQKPAPVRSGRSSTASNIRLDGSNEASDEASVFSDAGSAGLEPLDPSEAFAILAADTKEPPKGRSAAKKSRGVPFPATDEDVSLFEDSSTPRRPSAGKKAKTDPFARARGRQIEEEDEPEEEPPPRRKSERSERRPKSERDEPAPRKSERAEAPPRSKSERNERGASRRRSPPPPPPGGEDGEHGLVLSRIADPDKKEQAAELIVQIKGCSLDDARKLTDRTIIPVLKGVSRELAEHHLERFRELDIAGRVTTRQRS